MSISFKCTNSQCSGIIKSGTYYFKHQKCKKNLCFWCIFEIYKKQKQNINPKYPNKTKVKNLSYHQQRLKIALPCCKEALQSQFPLLEKFIASGCPFDGKECKSKESYKCLDELKIGKDCYHQFIINFKQTEYHKRMHNQIMDHALIECKACDQNLLNIIVSQQQPKQYYGLCEQCILKKVLKISEHENKPKACQKCQEEEVLDDYNKNLRKEDGFIVKKFHLTPFAKAYGCYFCIYKYWRNICQAFRQSKITFSNLIESTFKIQKLFIDHCLTCGNQTESGKNVFELKDQSIQSPYKLQVFLCGHCHALMSGKQKVTKTLHKLRIYLQDTKQEYTQIIQPIRFSEFKYHVDERQTYFHDMLEDEKILEDQKQRYEFKLKLKSAQNQAQEIEQKESKVTKINSPSKSIEMNLPQIKDKTKDKIPPTKQVEKRDSKRQQSKGLRVESKAKEQRPKSVKKIIQTKQTQLKYNQIKRTNEQKPVKISLNSQHDDQKMVSFKESSKTQGQKVNKLSRTAHFDQNQKPKQKLLLRKLKTQQISSKTSLTESKTESITESERSSAQDLTGSRESWTKQSVGDGEVMAQNDEFQSLEDQQGTEFDEKNAMSGDKFILEYERQKEEKRTKQVQEKPFITPQCSGVVQKVKQEEGSLGQSSNENVSEIKLDEFEFEQPISQQAKFSESDFHQKLESAVNKIQSLFPQLIKNLNAQNSYKPIGPKKKFSCQNCRKTQEDFLFVKKYCFRCFNSFLIGKNK